MNKRLIIKFILFAITLLPSLKSGAQNVLLGHTLRFDSVVVCKLLYSKNIVQKSIPRSSFKDTLILSNKEKKELELFLIERNYFQKIHRLLCFYCLEIKLLRIVNYWL